MKKNNLNITNIKFISKKILFIFLVLIIFLVCYMFSFLLLMIIEDNFVPTEYIMFSREYSSFFELGLVLIFTILYFTFIFKRKNFIKFNLKLILILVISIIFSVLLAYFFGNSMFWFLKYLIGVLIGNLFYFVYKTENQRRINILAGLVSIMVLLFLESIEYILIMDPPNNPSILYIRSFSNIIFWFATLVLVFVSAYIFSKGITNKETIN